MVIRTDGEAVLGSLLVVGDLHLGRRPVRLPPDCEDPQALGPGRAFERCIELALRADVAAVVLAGDVVESLEDRFEATRILAAGLARLQSRGIGLFAVAGNHDVHALPRVRSLHGESGFRILGADGGWEAVRIEKAGRPVCQLLGWSFQHTREPRSPLAELEAGLIDEELACIGVLHCDRDASASPYAPVAAGEFERGAAARCDAWLLGHVHKPDQVGLRQLRPVGYLGSVTANDPGEPGRHGPWLIEVRGKGRVVAAQQALSALRFETLELRLDELGLVDPAALEDHLFAVVVARFKQLHCSLEADSHALHAVGVRLLVRGTASCPAGVRRALHTLQQRGLYRDFGVDAGRVRYYCEALQVDVQPTTTLAEMAAEGSAIGILARQLLQLEADPEALLGPLRERIAAIRPGLGWPELRAATHQPEELAKLLQRCAFELIGELRQQRSGSPRPSEHRVGGVDE